MYPVTIHAYRYPSSEEEEWLAWKREPYAIPLCLMDDYIESINFLDSFVNNRNGVVGRGKTPNEAMNDLMTQLEQFDKENPDYVPNT